MDKIMDNDNALPLTALADGEEGIILSLAGGRDLAGRLAGMGISLNAKIRMIRNSSGLVMVLVGETRIALGHGDCLLYTSDAADE